MCSYQVREVLNIFKQFVPIDEMYLCGGAIRNYFLNNTRIKDLDIFVNCDQNKLDGLLGYLQSYGDIKYGPYGSPKFICHSSLRIDVDIVPFFNFIVTERSVSDIYSLLGNFDFSANAIAYDLKNENLINPFNGIEDIQARIIRALRTDFPEKNISSKIPLSSNSVFWFRLLHFQNTLGFSFDSSTMNWVKENAWRYKDLNLFTQYFFKPSISYEVISKLNL